MEHHLAIGALSAKASCHRGRNHATCYFLSNKPSLRAISLTEPACLRSRSEISDVPALDEPSAPAAAVRLHSNSWVWALSMLNARVALD